MTVLHDNLGNPIDAKNPLPVDVSTSDAIVPTDIQSHLQTTIQTHNAVSVAISGTSDSQWIDTDGYDKLAFNLKNDATTNTQAIVKWSIDGTTAGIYGADSLLASGAYTSANSRSAIVDTKARYALITIYNLDSVAAHTMTGYAYLKA